MDWMTKCELLEADEKLSNEAKWHIILAFAVSEKERISQDLRQSVIDLEEDAESYIDGDDII